MKFDRFYSRRRSAQSFLRSSFWPVKKKITARIGLSRFLFVAFLASPFNCAANDTLDGHWAQYFSENDQLAEALHFYADLPVADDPESSYGESETFFADGRKACNRQFGYAVNPDKNSELELNYLPKGWCVDYYTRLPSEITESSFERVKISFSDDGDLLLGGRKFLRIDADDLRALIKKQRSEAVD